MGRPIDYEVAKRILKEEFDAAEQEVGENAAVAVPAIIRESTDKLFNSSTQAFREALVGCCLAKIIDPTIDVRLIYMNQGDRAFNGRTLDENVVNPFLRDRMVPCSRGPYLSVLRRNVSLHEETTRGLRDRDAFGALLIFVGELEGIDAARTRVYLRHLLREFVRLREAANIQLARIARLSLEQYRILIAGMLRVPSGGLIPVLLSVAMFETLKECFKLEWVIEWQGINVADRASGVGGDITIKENGDTVVLAVEVTERPIDRSRVVATFNTKIAVHGISDYLFFFGNAAPGEEAKEAARQYFAQGHDISFLSVEEWLVHSLGTVGPMCRKLFTDKFLDLLGSRDVTAGLKMAWNDQVKTLLGG